MGRCPIKYISSDMAGVPQISNSWGDMVTALDAILNTGYNTKTISSITRIDDIATAQSAAHGYVVDQVILIANTGQDEYNGEQVVLTATTDSFTFRVTGAPVTPATTSSTISCKGAPLGFDIVYTATGKRVYRSPNVLSHRPYLRIDNTRDAGWSASYGVFARVTAAESMSDIDTFNAGARIPYDPVVPTQNETTGWFRWLQASSGTDGNAFYAITSVAPAGSRSFIVVGDDRGFYFFITPQNTLTTNVGARAAYYFGDFISYKPGDNYDWMLTACEYKGVFSTPSTIYNSGLTKFALNNSIVGKGLAKDSTGFGVHAPFAMCFMQFQAYSGADLYSGLGPGINTPNISDWSLVHCPVYIKESIGNLRGEMPGIFAFPHQNPGGDLMTYTDVPKYPGRRFKFISFSADASVILGKVSVDLTGPWR